MVIRLEGLPAEVEEARKRLPGVFTVVEESKVYPNHGESRQVRQFITIHLDSPSELGENTVTPGQKCPGVFTARGPVGIFVWVEIQGQPISPRPRTATALPPSRRGIP